MTILKDQGQGCKELVSPLKRVMAPSERGVCDSLQVRMALWWDPIAASIEGGGGMTTLHSIESPIVVNRVHVLVNLQNTVLEFEMSLLVVMGMCEIFLSIVLSS